ncbi:MAG: endonuclease Q family protein [Candidatus Jordarchaeum sp.]|uniref:endonuclease Q family protein n=1 Tax=Candidatus Jordarchaeum sp. TaxID=2823881 RepID=UPI0040492231
MRFFSDLHIHSKYSRATSDKMDIENLIRYAKVKGLNLLGTGDLSHPKWLTELKSKLKEIDDSGFYILEGESQVFFILSTEVSTVFNYKGASKKIHHVLFAPNFKVVDRMNDFLAKYGKLEVDGRPQLSISPAELIENLIEIDERIFILPAHLWTSWFGALGENGFDRLEDCYEDQLKHIYSVETGLSSDPPMNWRLSALDKYVLMSNSDAHSPWSWRLGREANVYELEEPSYQELTDAIKAKNRKKIVMTIEVDPAYGN